jgi:WD40 repeat protein
LDVIALEVLTKSPDGRKVLIRLSNSTARIWNLETGKGTAQDVQHESKILAGCFSPDGHTLVTGGHDQQIRIWDSSTGKPMGDPIRHGGIVKTVAFSHSGKLILSGSSDQTAQIWDAQTRAPLGQAMQHPRELVKVAFSPDDRLALTISTDNLPRLWEVGTSQLLARPLQYELGLNGAKLEVQDGLFDADGSVVRFQCADRTIRVYKVPQQLPDNPKLISSLALAHSAFQLDSHGILRQLSQSEWLDARRQLESLQESK